MIAPLRIGIVGCGTTGPAAALLLREQGHDITVFDAAPTCLPVGAGFLLQPSGMSVLDRLGLLDEVLRHAAKISGLAAFTRKGKTVLDLHYGAACERSHGAGLHRSVLLSAFLEAMSEAGIRVKWGQRVEQVSEDQRYLITNSGDSLGPFDLLLLADGSQSATRSSLGLRQRSTRYPWGALWWVGQDHDGVFDDSLLYQIVDSTDHLTGFLPTGLKWQASQHSAPCVSLFWSLRLDQRTTWLNTPIEKWKEQVIRQCPRAETFIRPIQSHEEMSLASYHDVVMNRYHTARCAILGDAAHAMSPQLGQGVNLGLLDAACLADALAERDTLMEALELYSRKRKASLSYYQFATRWLTPVFQSDHRWIAPLRDIAFPIMTRFGLARRQMIETMMGIKSDAIRNDSALSQWMKDRFSEVSGKAGESPLPKNLTRN
ncbi:MAG: NAD(P)/FAD-dependent oxidoreductase [Verrucomicrobiota bacterium]